MDLEILKIASNTENNKVIKNYTHLSKNKNPVCGYVMEITLLVKNDLIEDIGYQCRSCVYCQASVSLLSRKAKNKKINQIKELINIVEDFFNNTQTKINNEWEVFKKILNVKNNSRKECLLLPFKTISKALKFKS